MSKDVETHYTHGDLIAAIRGGLEAAGKDLDKLVPADLAAVDEFHIRGRKASIELADKLDLGPGARVLDIGSGTGGAARLLAAEYGCRVTGIDLTEAFCGAATEIAGWVGLDHLVDYRQGDALDLAFEDASFDAAWTQHVAMNIADKGRLYREARRVLKPGGRFAIYDILQGSGGEIHFPVPWARDPSISFLVRPEELRALLTGAGFEIESWRDTTELGRDWFDALLVRTREGGTPPLGFHLLLGPEYAQMIDSQRRNLEEDRIVLIETVCRAV